MHASISDSRVTDKECKTTTAKLLGQLAVGAGAGDDKPRKKRRSSSGSGSLKSSSSSAVSAAKKAKKQKLSSDQQVDSECMLASGTDPSQLAHTNHERLHSGGNSVIVEAPVIVRRVYVSYFESTVTEDDSSRSEQ